MSKKMKVKVNPMKVKSINPLNVKSENKSNES